jgi:TRAP-type C4-dicarboxylate transport system permease small subunit
MKKILICLFILLTFILNFNLVLAQQTTQNNTGSTKTTQNNSSGSCSNGSCTLTNPLSVNTPQALIGKIINSVLGVVGSLALLMFIYGGLTWMTSSGNQEKVKKGRDIILWSAIGLMVVFLSYTLTRFVLSTIAQ